MQKIKVVVNNESGLHARPATQLASEALKYQSDIKVIRQNNQEANAKSVMSVLALCVSAKEEVELLVHGEDEELALKAIVNLLETSLAK